MKYKVLIPTSGIGSRLGEITKFTNKSLVKIGKKPAISYIIEKYPKDIEFVITLGYFGDHIRQFLSICYPERNFTFVEVDRYEGIGTSLGYSMLHAKEHLQCPFIYNACDTITFDEINAPSKNWISGYPTDNLSQYDSYNISDGKVSHMFEKGELCSDFAYIGLIGINDYSAFWENLQILYKENPNNSNLSDFWCVKRLLEKGLKINHIESKSWHDIGNVRALQKARNDFPDKFPILDKPKESIYLFDSYVVKFFSDEKIVENRIERSKMLKGLTPDIVEKEKNFYKYKYVSGDLFSEVVTLSSFIDLLKWLDVNLWKDIVFDSHQHKTLCNDFYIKKTRSRIEDFLKGNADKEDSINGDRVPTIKEMFGLIDSDWLCESSPKNFHGDLILDNIIKTDDGYSLIDWRQDFGGNTEVGDMYYDLAKLNHNLTINHDIINSDLYSISKKESEVIVDIHRKQILIDCQCELHEWIVNKGYDLDKVKIMTCIIWLNMSSLHHRPFDEFLFYFGKHRLYKEIKRIKRL